MSPTVHYLAWAFGCGRVMIGLAPFVAVGPLSKTLGFPAAHNTPTTRLMARLFGVRDIGLGVLAAWAASDLQRLQFVAVFQACTDGGDLVSIAIPLLRREGIDRAALSSGAFALGGAIAWIVLLVLASNGA